MNKARPLPIASLSVILALVALMPSLGNVGAMKTKESSTVVTSLRDPGPFEKAVARADVIVLGEVTRVGTPVLSNQPPVTPGQVPFGRVVRVPVKFKVAEVLKGNAKPGQTIPIAQLGGQVGQTTVVFQDETHFEVGETLLLCLYKPGGVYETWTGGLYYADEGKYVIDKAGVATNVFRNEVMPLDVLRARIESALSSQN